MACPRLVSVWLLRNHGAIAVYSSTRRGMVRRFVAPDGDLSMAEAARALKTNRQMIWRMARAGLIVARVARSRWCVPLAEIRRRLALPRGERATCVRRKPNA